MIATDNPCIRMLSDFGYLDCVASFIGTLMYRLKPWAWEDSFVKQKPTCYRF